MLGDEQRAWAHERIRDTTRPWCLLVTAVVLNHMELPVEHGATLGDLAPSGYAVIGGKAMCTDEWDGYPAERERLVEVIAERGPGLVALSGDVHSAWAFEGPCPERDGDGGLPVGGGVRDAVRHGHAHGPPAAARVAQAAGRAGRAAARGPLVRARAPRVHGARGRRGAGAQPLVRGRRRGPRGPRARTAPRGPTGGATRGASSRSTSAPTPRRRCGRAPGRHRRARRSWCPARPEPVLDGVVPHRRRRRRVLAAAATAAAAAALVAAVRHRRSPDRSPRAGHQPISASSRRLMTPW